MPITLPQTFHFIRDQKQTKIVLSQFIFFICSLLFKYDRFYILFKNHQKVSKTSSRFECFTASKGSNNHFYYQQGFQFETKCYFLLNQWPDKGDCLSCS